MLCTLLFPGFTVWYVGCIWALGASLPGCYLARKKNRSLLAWGMLCGLTSFFFGVVGLLWIVLLATREKISMRMKYLGFKLEEQIADALRLPSPIGNDLGKRILVVLAYNPQGLRIGALAQGIGQSWRHIEAVIQELVAQGKIRKEGDRFFFNLE